MDFGDEGGDFSFTLRDEEEFTEVGDLAFGVFRGDDNLETETLWSWWHS